jgi:hypothetical protein
MKKVSSYTFVLLFCLAILISCSGSSGGDDDSRSPVDDTGDDA